MKRRVEPASITPYGVSSPVSRRGVLLGAGGIVASAALAGVWHPAVAQAAGEDSKGGSVLQFTTMVGVSGVFVGSTGTAIRGIHGGGLPWTLDAADGVLRSDGRLRVRVRGLVLAGGPPAIIGTNPIPTFRAIVSFENAAPIFTDPVPATTTGDAEIHTHVDLPHPGFAPILFVAHGAAEAWFAVTGLP